MVIAAPAGLHARPAIRLSKLAKRFSAKILVRSENAGEWVDAKSIVRLMGLRVTEGRRMQFWIRGADAEQAVTEITALAARNFDDTSESLG